MKRALIPAAVAALFLSAGLLRAEDAVAIKFKDPAQGDVVRVEKTETTTATNKAVDAAGKVLGNTEQVVEESATYTETVVKCEKGKHPTRLERKYDKAVVKIDGKEMKLAYDGKTVVIEQKDGKYRFTVDGKELAADDARSLAKEFGNKGESPDLEKLVLPKSPIKEKESWTIDMAPIVKDIAKEGEMELDADKATGTGTLLKAYKKDDKQFGRLKVELKLPLKQLGKGATKIVADQGSFVSMEANPDGCIDGTADVGTVKSTFKMELKGSQSDGQGGKVGVTISVLTKAEETRKEPPKK
jgi:hypothetical protein